MRPQSGLLVCGSLALLFIAQRAEGTINCYKCSGKKDGGCGETWDEEGMSTVLCDGSCEKLQIGVLYSRGCVATVKDNGCTGDSSDEAGESCYCDEDECNSGTKMAASVVAMAFTALLAAIFN